MKNIIKSISLLIVTGVLVNSCLIDNDNLADTFDDGLNFTSFSRLNQPVSAVADGNIVTANVNVELQGPTMVGFTEDVTVSVAVDTDNTTAIEGVHYNFSPTTITLRASNNYIGSLPVDIITEGIDPPLAVAPILSLKFTNASGTNVIPSSKAAVLTIIYQCYADLSGTYLVTNDFCGVSKTTTITKNPDGSWHLGTADGYFLDSCTSNSGLFNSGNIVELCGDILPSGDLEFGTGGGYGIGDIIGGSWNAETGVLTLINQDVSFFEVGQWTSTYVRQ
ncbi:hypothetical protein [Snuella lapsa]|uniref:Uncharacterized protein n=1 Tax=Snuella lapsa TaxID=870481 RepID=A0ABP6Y065_9FLAO